MTHLRNLFDLFKDSFMEWNSDRAPLLAAALAYYTAFSIAPLLIVIIAIVGLFVSQDAVQTQIIQQIDSTVGKDAANIIVDLIANSTQPEQGIISSLIGIVALLLGALGVFNSLQTALDIIWDVEDVSSGNAVRGFITDRLLSFGMILVIGFLLLVSLILSVIFSMLDNFTRSILPAAEFILQLVNFVVSFGVITFLFMLIFKYLPHARIEWRDVTIGAMVTAFLFTIGKTALSLYLADGATVSSYGAAGALAVILLWVYYSAQILLFGAEFTQVFARKYGSQIVSRFARSEQHERASSTA